ncbi:methylated-DNA--[protein]-cysteine S-methyltransferase [Panacibacter ginsenosidivorans]|uniref:methylated-DNA--[protein]-cysteine S-methyltransferase n=1 Tax=Panacibacter ginsenosidivorans TaxID=1813871 RepID=A0A5B8V8I9_9BACT|nr:methylated-DNA--[protein]-cysteine S-methyltransferase [Panacibacter ginsenosidivorans]QEC67714.1 methylated-DNA--[protein]-cysteine S-methyltransferase [Panacibacter ginsenosidivorans]
MRTDYDRIEQAILYIKENFQQQPALDDVAKQVHVSSYHFQRMFKDWAGVSPKKFLQYISLEHAKKLLQQNASLADASFETGLSGTSRLHDLFISIEGMTPGEYKNGGENLEIHYSHAETLFGDVIIASTSKGICHLAFIAKETEAVEQLKAKFPNALLIQKTDLMQQHALEIFKGDWENLAAIKLHLKGTPFQLKVWETLLHIPLGGVTTYGTIASYANQPNASRAVGTAIGSNPVAYLIPCHRVIRATGITGEYAWGSTRKTALLGWESAKIFGDN